MAGSTTSSSQPLELEATREFVSAFLTLTTGPRAGANYFLETDLENQVGRGKGCAIIVDDPLSSRVHAVISCRPEGWWIRDAGSRNGTYLNGQKIDDARLSEGSIITIGKAQFKFSEANERNSKSFSNAETDIQLTQTLVYDTPVRAMAAESVSSAFLLEEGVYELLDLYHLAVTLLGCGDPDEVVRLSLEFLRQHSHASLAGFLWRAEDGTLKPKLVIPEDQSGKASLSRSLTEHVLKEGRAIQVNSQEGPEAESLHFADAICVPLLLGDNTLGVIHLYLEDGRFESAVFEIALSVANILVTALTRAREWVTLQTAHERLVDKSAGFDEMIGESQPMAELKNKIRRVARAAGCVLVRGESGCGKELVARAVHKASPRADRPMLSVNCAAIPRDLMESQLFGHKRGAFTGADTDHVGWFEQADSGTLFLDEVGEMTLEGQAKLLRILEHHPFLPVGAQKEVSVDVRVIAATNRDLREFVRDGRFREDLYYRLSVFELYIPPLRDRGEDIERLIRFFVDHFKRQHGRADLEINPGAMDKLLSYQWPGNVRQLRNVIDSAVVLAEDHEITPDDLGLRDVGGGELESLRIDYWERKLIQQALERTGGNIPNAARLLGIGRATLYRKVEEYGIAR